MNSNTLTKNYRNHLSDFLQWEQLSHAKDHILFPENIGEKLSIDETSLHGELYTIILNKEKKGRKGSIIAIIKGTKNSIVSEVLQKIPVNDRMNVKEVTADMAESMNWIIRTNFMNATKIVDRFHVQKLVSDALQEVRVQHRWKAIEEENILLQEAKDNDQIHTPIRFENGDTKKQLLARSRGLLFKPQSKWSDSQKQRAVILFREFPDAHKAYELSMMFRNFYEAKTLKEAEKRLQHWFEKIESYKQQFPAFITAAESIRHHKGQIMNYFHSRATNANAESFNAKIKGFRALLRGVRDVEFFLFRVSKLYA